MKNDKKRFAKFRKFVWTHQFVAFIALALVIAGVMTAVSLEIYVTSGTIKLDLSRPGYEKLRKDVQDTSAQSQFSATGAVDSSTLKDFGSRMDAAQKDLKSSGNFGGADNLSDASLGL